MNLSEPVGSPAAGFNPAKSTVVTSANQIDPNLKALITESIVAGMDYELRPQPGAAAERTATHGRRGSVSGIFNRAVTPRVGVGLSDYAQGVGLPHALDGTAYNIRPSSKTPQSSAAGGSGFVIANIPDHYIYYHGIEIGIVKRLFEQSGRAGPPSSWNNARQI